MRTNLKLFRIKRNLTQAEMAAKVGYCRNHYARIENGEQDATMKLAVRLQEAFALPTVEVMELIKTDEK